MNFPRNPNRRTRPLLFAAILAAAAVPALGQQVVLGQLRSKAQTAVTLPSGALTLVDFAAPATAAGQITSVTVDWAGGGVSPCSPGFKLKFFRPSSSGASLTYLGERGPFPALRGLMVLSLSPPMAVQAKDVIGITEFGGPVCGGVGNTNTGAGVNTALFAGDVTTDKTLVQATGLQRTAISLQGTGGSPDVRTAVIPVVLSGPGKFGSVFKTAVEVLNPDAYPISGKLVFHPHGVSASPSDPSLAFTLTGGQTLSYDDLVATMGQTGAGSLDVVSTSSPPPLILARVFNDAGAAGTSGFTEAAVSPDAALQVFDSARLVAPADPVNFRLNIGVRTLSLGVSLSVAVYDTSGHFVTSLPKSYPPEYFEQVPLADFLPGVTVGPNQTIAIFVNSGSAIVYGATADNRTNDPSVQLGNRNDF